MTTKTTSRRVLAGAAAVPLASVAAKSTAHPNAELEQLGRDLAKACLARVARDATLLPMILQEKRGTAHSLVASVVAQAQLRRDWYFALGRELEERRLIAGQLMAEGLRLIAPDERQQFVALAMQCLGDIEPALEAMAVRS